MTEVLLETEFASLVYDADAKMLHHVFFKHAEGADFRIVLETGVDFIAEYGVVKWLSDDRNLRRISEEDSRWLLDDWSPRAMESGWRYWALVVPDVVSARADYLSLIQNAEMLNVRIRLFSEVNDALEWLGSKN